MSDSSYQPSERRPIASRETWWAAQIAEWMARNRFSPNAISLVGMLAAILAGVAFASTSFAPSSARMAWIVGAGLCQVRLLANLFDGMVAIRRQIASAIGELYNEVPDRVSDIAIFAALGYAAGGNATLGWMAATSAVLTAYVRSAVKVAGGPQDYVGPMAKPQRMFLATLLGVAMGTLPSKWQSISIFGLERPGGLPAFVLFLIAIGGMITSLRRLVRGSRFLRNR